MSYAEDEPTPNDISAIRRYFFDISLGKTEYVDIAMSLEKMFEGEGMLDKGVDRDFIWRYIDIVESGSYDRRVRTEQYLLLPLRYMASYIEVSRGADETYEWYKESAQYVEKYTENMHSINCLRLDNKSGQSGCIESTECPIRFVQDALTRDVIEPDFESFSYFLDQKKGRNVTLNKLLLAKQRNYIEAIESVTMMDTYIEKYNEYFNIKAITAKPEDVS